MNKENNTMVFHQNELPQAVDVIGEDGQRMHYEIRPAGRKTGAFLAKNENQPKTETK